MAAGAVSRNDSLVLSVSGDTEAARKHLHIASSVVIASDKREPSTLGDADAQFAMIRLRYSPLERVVALTPVGSCGEPRGRDPRVFERSVGEFVHMSFERDAKSPTLGTRCHSCGVSEERTCPSMGTITLSSRVRHLGQSISRRTVLSGRILPLFANSSSITASTN